MISGVESVAWILEMNERLLITLARSSRLELQIKAFQLMQKNYKK